MLRPIHCSGGPVSFQQGQVQPWRSPVGHRGGFKSTKDTYPHRDRDVRETKWALAVLENRERERIAAINFGIREHDKQNVRRLRDTKAFAQPIGNLNVARLP